MAQNCYTVYIQSKFLKNQITEVQKIKITIKTNEKFEIIKTLKLQLRNKFSLNFND